MWFQSMQGFCTLNKHIHTYRNREKTLPMTLCILEGFVTFQKKYSNYLLFDMYTTVHYAVSGIVRTYGNIVKWLREKQKIYSKVKLENVSPLKKLLPTANSTLSRPIKMQSIGRYVIFE